MSDNSVSIANTPLPVTVQNFPPPGAAGAVTATVTRLPVNSVPLVVLIPNSARKKLIIAVETTVPLYILFATTQAAAQLVSATNYTRVIMDANDDMSDDVWNGFVGVVCPPDPGGDIQVTELA